MGVLGLWNLLEPVGKPVPIESLENKILAIDISIWLNQAVKGYRDRTGNAVPHAHLLGLYNRVCKLLFYRIKPVFVFDGQAPQLKRDTLIRRRMRKSKVTRKAQAASAKILDNYLKSQAIAQKLQRQSYAIDKINRGGTDAIHNLLTKRTESKDKDMFELPDLPGDGIRKEESSDSSSDSEAEVLLDQLGVDTSDIYNLDVNADNFKVLPQELQYDVLNDMREKRKQNSWAKIHQMPSKAENFSSFQLERLKHRRNIQKTLDNVKGTMIDDLDNSYSEQLFVGDLSGVKSLKKELKKNVSASSQGGSTTILISGIQAAKESEREKSRLEKEALEKKRSKELEKLNEKRELVDNPDDPILDEAMARSLDDTGLTQDEILAMIKQEDGTEENPATVIDDDEIILLPDASSSYITSNRSGGQIIKIEIKDEPIDDLSDDPDDTGTKLENKTGLYSKPGMSTQNLQPTIKKETINLDSERIKPEKEDSNQDQDMFADIFRTKEDTSALLEIFENANGAKISQEETSEKVDIMSDSDDDSESNLSNVDVISVTFDSDTAVGVMSDSDSSDSIRSSTKDIENKEDDDLFGDIFADSENVQKLETILSSKKSDTKTLVVGEKRKLPTADINADAEEILAKVTKLDKPTDIFSAISKIARGRVESEDRPAPKRAPQLAGGFIASTDNTNVINDNEASDGNYETDSGKESDSGIAPEEVAAAMKKSSHLWMKIASKYAQDAAAKSPSKDIKSPVQNAAKPNVQEEIVPIKKAQFGETLQEENLVTAQQRLVQEMRDKEKANRLLKYTQMTYNSTTTPAEDNPDDDLDEFDDTNDANDDATNTELAKLGVQSTDADKYKTRVLREEGLIDDGPSTDKAKAQNMDSTVDTTKKNNDVIYSASAPGFNIGSQADSGRVVNVENSNIIGLDITEATSAEGDDNEMFEEADLYRIQAELAQQNSALVAEMNKADRVANSITDQMYSECQELLQLFGIPWIVSPTEAESQCAWLDENGLTQGTITDDSDIWLFGGRRVYKNFFNQEKFVEMFKNEEISHHFGLNREKLILLAMLTGSDYTEGVEGVGPVTALEVLAEFPGDGLSPLIEFKSWWSRVHQEYGKEFGMPIGNSTREKLRKLKLAPGFPSEQVMSAYLDPKIDHDKAKFSWSIPNFVALRDFAQERFGWAKLQVDELIQPVIRSLKSSNHQGRIDSFFTSYRTNLPEKGLQSSKRVNEALRKVKGLPSPIKPTSTKQLLPSKSNVSATSSKSPTTVGKKSGKVNKKSRAVIDIEASGSKVEKVPDSSSVVNEASTSNNQPSSQGSSNKQEVSLIANSCGFVINPSKDDIILQREERKRKEKEARERAAEIWKKAQQQKKKKRFKRPARVKLADQHHLSDEEDD